MTDPKELAKAVVLEAFHHDPAAFVAAQYLGLDFGNPNVMQDTFGDALRPEVVTVEEQFPQTSYHAVTVRRPIRVMEQPLIRRSSKPPPAMTTDRQLFIDWMEKRIPDDDPRVKAMLMKGMRGE